MPCFSRGGSQRGRKFPHSRPGDRAGLHLRLCGVAGREVLPSGCRQTLAGPGGRSEAILHAPARSGCRTGCGGLHQLCQPSAARGAAGRTTTSTPPLLAYEL